jgi:putative endonuclease
LQRKSLGNLGETLAKGYLESIGYSIVERNWHYSRYGEIDIIAFEPDKQVLAFVEVKTRRTDTYGSPLESISEEKQRKMRFLAEVYIALQAHALPVKHVSMDVITVTSDGDGQKIQHYQSAF